MLTEKQINEINKYYNDIAEILRNKMMILGYNFTPGRARSTARAMTKQFKYSKYNLKYRNAGDLIKNGSLDEIEKAVKSTKLSYSSKLKIEEE